jgi:hypothetical protein
MTISQLKPSCALRRPNPHFILDNPFPLDCNLLMRLHVLGDLHLEFGPVNIPPTDADVVVRTSSSWRATSTLDPKDAGGRANVFPRHPSFMSWATTSFASDSILPSSSKSEALLPASEHSQPGCFACKRAAACSTACARFGNNVH